MHEPRMKKDRIVKDDGRYLVYYKFEIPVSEQALQSRELPNRRNAEDLSKTPGEEAE